MSFFLVLFLWSSPQTVENSLVSLSSFHEVLLQNHLTQGMIVFYNVKSLEKPKIAKKNPSVFTQKEIDYFYHLEDTAEVLLKIDPSGPSLIALSEIHDENVIEDLIATLTSKLKSQNLYHYVITDKKHPYLKCLNLALIYKIQDFTLEKSKNLTPYENSTRDILFIKGNYLGHPLNLFINHWLSRINAEKGLNSRRITANFLKTCVEKLSKKFPNEAIISLGDFNDEPHDQTLHKELNARLFYEEFDPFSLINITSYLNDGSYFFNKKWYAIDQILTSIHFFEPEFPLNISIPFYYKKDDFYPDDYFRFKERVSVGLRSDHRPIVSMIYVKESNF